MDKIQDVIPEDRQPELIDSISRGNVSMRVMRDVFESFINMGPMSQVGNAGRVSALCCVASCCVVLCRVVFCVSVCWCLAAALAVAPSPGVPQPLNPSCPSHPSHPPKSRSWA